MVKVLEVLPNETANATVFCNGLEGAIRGLVCHGRTTNGHIVDIGDSVLGNLRLEDMSYIVMEDGDH